MGTATMAPQQMPSFDETLAVLKNSNVKITPSKTHGMVCGFICAGDKMNGTAWIEPILGYTNTDNPLAKESRATLIKLYEISCRQLQQMEFDFSILLPDDETDLDSRALALGDWCDGFVKGLELAGITIEFCPNAEIQDVLIHFSEISNIDYDVVDISEEDEKAYMEVVEYVRMAVLMIYSEYSDPNGTSGGYQKPTASPTTLH